jgi:hypothetical protein
MLWQNSYLQLMVLSCCLIISIACRHCRMGTVKHRLATTPKDWEYSSFHSYVRDGMYDLEWGAGRDITIVETIGREQPLRSPPTRFEADHVLTRCNIDSICFFNVIQDSLRYEL